MQYPLSHFRQEQLEDIQLLFSSFLYIVVQLKFLRPIIYMMKPCITQLLAAVVPTTVVQTALLFFGVLFWTCPQQQQSSVVAFVTTTTTTTTINPNDKRRLSSLSRMITTTTTRTNSLKQRSAITTTTTTKTRLDSIPNALDTITSGLASICRLPHGITVDSNAFLPNEQDGIRLRKLYNVENCNSCRLVRERLTELDLIVEMVIPAASNSRAMWDTTYDYAIPMDGGGGGGGGVGTTIPTLVASRVDGMGNEEERILSGEIEIVNFLNQAFVKPDNSKEKKALFSPLQAALDFINPVGQSFCSLLRTGRGCEVSPSCGIQGGIDDTTTLSFSLSRRMQRPKQPLVLYSYEGNQFCRLVREVLTELDLIYELRSVGKGSPRRSELAQLTGGSTQCPYLVDPNTNVAMTESADIVAYLYDRYALWTPPSELWEWISDMVISQVKPLMSYITPLQAGANNNKNNNNKRNNPMNPNNPSYNSYEMTMDQTLFELSSEIQSYPVVIYTYSWSPYCWEAKTLLDRLNVDYKEICIGRDWKPGFLSKDGAMKRAALLKQTGQSSLPHIFVNQQSIGGLFSGTPGLIPALQDDNSIVVMELLQDRP